MSTVAASKTHDAIANGQPLTVALNDGFRWAYAIGADAFAAFVMLRGRPSEPAVVALAE